MFRNSRSFKAVTATAALVAAATLGSAAPANASDFPKCVAIGTAGNRLCIQFINNNTGVNIWYEKRAGNPVTVRFSYESGPFGQLDDGWFTAYVRTAPFSYAWNNANPGSCIIGFLHTSTGPTYNTGQNCL